MDRSKRVFDSLKVANECLMKLFDGKDPWDTKVGEVPLVIDKNTKEIVNKAFWSIQDAMLHTDAEKFADLKKEAK